LPSLNLGGVARGCRHLPSSHKSGLLLASSNLIDEDFCRAHKIKLIPQPSTDLHLLNGAGEKSHIIYKAIVHLTFTQLFGPTWTHFLDTTTTPFPVVLGMSWLLQNSPLISWLSVTICSGSHWTASEQAGQSFKIQHHLHAGSIVQGGSRLEHTSEAYSQSRIKHMQHVQ
jgi:hypothetical protein